MEAWTKVRLSLGICAAVAAVAAAAAGQPQNAQELCEVGFRATIMPEVREEVEGARSKEACAQHCESHPTCTMFHFEVPTGICSVRVRGDGGVWCRRESEQEHAIRLVWEKAARRDRSWSKAPEYPQLWCNTGESGFGEKGWATPHEAHSLESCQAACDGEDDCVGVSYFGVGDGTKSRISSVLDHVTRPPCNSALKVFAAFDNGGAACNNGFSRCINRPTDISDIVEGTQDSLWDAFDMSKMGAVDGQCIEDTDLPKCTLCYRMVTQCFVHGDASDCTTLQVQGQRGGTYVKPQLACPSRVGGGDECVNKWFHNTCGTHEGGAQCDSAGSKCTCQAEDKPCARKLMGAQQKSLKDMGYDDATYNQYPDVKSTENELGACVSEEDFCKVRKTFQKSAPVTLAFLQAELVAISLMSTVVQNQTGTLEQSAKEMVCQYMSPISQIDGTLGNLQAPAAVVMARVFGMLVCYTEMIASEEDDRGREFGHCMVRAVLRLVTYLAMEYTGLNEAKQASLEAKVAVEGLDGMLGATNAAIDEAAAEAPDTVLQLLGHDDKQELFNKAHEHIGYASVAAEKSSLVANMTGLATKAPQWDDWGISDALDAVQATAQVVDVVASAIDTLDNMIVEIGTMVVTAVLDRVLDLSKWAEGQPKGVDIDGFFCEHLSDKIIAGAFDQMRRMFSIIAKEMKAFVEGQVLRVSTGQITSCTHTPPHSMCGLLGHNYEIAVEYRDVNMLGCQEKAITDQYRALTNSSRMASVVHSNPVCEDSLKDLLCLSAFPGCPAEPDSGCDQFTSCKIACRNLNTCATSLAFKEPFDCDLKCSCATDCVREDVENGLQVHAQQMSKCKDICDKNQECEETCEAEFDSNKKAACKAANKWDWNPEEKARASRKGKKDKALHNLMEIPGYMPSGGSLVPAEGTALRPAFYVAVPFAFGAGVVGLVVFAGRRLGLARGGPGAGEELLELMGGEHAA